MNPAIVAAIFRGARAYALYSAGSRSARGRQDEPSEAQQMRESQRRFRDRLARGEVISDEELANAPVGHVPEELSERRWNARFNQSIRGSGQAVASVAQSGGSGGPRWAWRGRGAVGGGAMAGGAAGGGGGAAGGGHTPAAGGQPGRGDAGGAGGGAAPGIGDFIRVMAKAAATVTGFVKGLELLNRGVIAVHQNLSRFDGRLAQAYASLEVADIRRGQERSQRIGGSLSSLIDAQNELRDTTYGIGTEVQGLITDLAGKVTRGVNYVNKITMAGEAAIAILQGIREFLGAEAATDTELPPWSNFFHDVSNGTFEGKVQQFPVNAGRSWRDSARESALRGRPGA